MKHTPVTPMRTRAHIRTGKSGFTIAEAVIAVGISALCLGGVMLLNAQQLKLVKSTRQSNAVSFSLQDRVEQLRLTAWDNLTDSEWLKTKVFNTNPSCSAFLGDYQERFRLSPWPANPDVQALEITNTSANGFSVVSDSTGMKNEKQGRVDFIVTWRGSDGRVRERSYATLISNGGITRVGLSGYGSYSGNSNGSTGTSDSTGSTGGSSGSSSSGGSTSDGSSSGGSTSDGTSSGSTSTTDSGNHNGSSTGDNGNHNGTSNTSSGGTKSNNGNGNIGGKGGNG